MASVYRSGTLMWLLAAVLTAGAAMPALAKFESGPWTGNAYAQKDGKFERCVITSEHADGMRLGFGKAADGSFEIWLMNKSWNLEPGAPQTITLWVDTQGKRSGNFQTVSKEAMATQIKDAAGLIESLKRGNVLYIQTPLASMSFKLTGTFKAIGELDQCWAQSSRGAAGGGQAAAAAPAKRVKGMDLLSLTPRAFAGQVVTSANNDYFTIPAQPPENMRKWNAALIWNIKGDAGVGLSSGVGSNPDIESLRTELVRLKQPGCRGELASASDVRTLPGTAIQVKRVEVRCSDVGDGNGVTEVISFYPHLSGQLLVVSHIAGNREAAQAADGEFAKRVTAILKAK